MTETDQVWAVEASPRGAGWIAVASTTLFVSTDARAMHGGFAQSDFYRGY